MARRGTIKAFSVKQEDWLARLYGGKRSASSGAADNDQGDVRCKHILIEAKYSSKVPAWVKEFQKVTFEAYAEGKDPVLAFRFFEPGHILANQDGHIDLVVRRAREDALREEAYAEAR
jgi:hypothetical protein